MKVCLLYGSSCTCMGMLPAPHMGSQTTSPGWIVHSLQAKAYMQHTFIGNGQQSTVPQLSIMVIYNSTWSILIQ